MDHPEVLKGNPETLLLALMAMASVLGPAILAPQIADRHPPTWINRMAKK